MRQKKHKFVLPDGEQFYFVFSFRFRVNALDNWRTVEANLNSFSFTDTELEELEAPPRYRPDSLKALSTATRFSEAEIKHIYRGFKAECPSGIVREDKFKHIYSQFFPTGGWSGTV